MKRLHVAAFCLVLATIAVVVIFWTIAPERRISVYSGETIDCGSAIRHYRLVIPEADRDTRLPIVFAFHGSGDSPESMATYSGLDQTAAEYGFILVYPAAQRSMWTTENPDESELDANVDVQFFDKLLKRLSRERKIDEARVYVIGMSNGAPFAQLLAMARSNKITAVAVACSPKPDPVVMRVNHGSERAEEDSGCRGSENDTTRKR